MLLDRKVPRSSGLPRFKPASQPLKQQQQQPSSPVQQHSSGSPGASTKHPEHDAPHPPYSLAAISSLSSIKNWFESSPPTQAPPSIPQPSSSPTISRAVFPFVPAHHKSANPSTTNILTPRPSFNALDAPSGPSQPNSAHGPPPAGSSSTPTPTMLSSTDSLKPLGNSFRRRTPANLFTRRLSSSTLLRNQPDLEKRSKAEKQSKNRNSVQMSGLSAIGSLIAQEQDTLSTQKSHPPSKPPHIKSTHLPTLDEVSLSSFPGESMNVLSLGIQYHTAPTPEYPLQPPAPPRDPPPLKPGPRGSSLRIELKRFSGAPQIVPTTPQYHSPSRLNSRGSTLTLASTCDGSASDDEFQFSDLASIQLPSSPTDGFNPSVSSIDLISDFPMPPSRGAFLSSSVGSSPVPHPPPSHPIGPISLDYSPFLPPQIPLPPLPPSRKFDLNEHPNHLRSWSPLSYPDKTPTQPMRDGLAGSRPSTNPSNPSESPDISGATCDVDDFLDMYGNQNSPVAPQRFQRLDRTRSPNLSGTSAGGKSMDSLTHNTNLLDVDLPSRTNSPDPLTPEELDKEAHNIFAASDEALDLSHIGHMGSTSEGEDTTSEIDLNEPLDMMAVRLGYQLDLADGSGSDDGSDLRRNEEFDDDDELLDNGPPPSRGPSRSGLSQMRSPSSLRTHLNPSRARVNRVVIAEVSSSDEEEFDLKLDHQHLSKHARGHESSELSGALELKWHASRNGWGRSSIGSTGTLGSFTTTPSSSHSSYQTNLSTPNSTQAVNILEPSGKEIRGLVGLGFDVEVPAQGLSSPTTRLPQLDTREHQLPGKPGSSERREWLQRAFCKREARVFSQERSSSMPGLFKPEPEEPASPLRGGPLEDEETMGQDQLGKIPAAARAANRSSARRLKPLMLVSRKERHLSYPLINSTIAEEDSPPLAARSMIPSSINYNQPVRNSCTILSPGALSPHAPAVRTRTSLVNLSYHRSSSTHHPLHLPRPSAV